MLEKSYKVFYVGHVTVKYLSYTRFNSVNPLYLIINKVNGYIKESDGNTYLTVFPTNASKDTLKKYEELWDKITDLIRSVTNNLNNYNEKYMKTKFNLDDVLLLKITPELCIFFISAKDNTFIRFLAECLYKLKMLESHRIT